MCIIVAKHFKGIGWVGAKNRDRNYIPRVKMVQSNRGGVQRLYIDDTLSRYTEGVNEFGVCILSASLAVKDDEKELRLVRSNGKKKKGEEGYASPDGKKIRTAMFEKTPLAAINKLIESELSGCTLAFDEHDCYLLEGGSRLLNPDAKEGETLKFKFTHKVIKIPTSEWVVRTNHGILLPQFGYSKDSDDPKVLHSRKSSESRYNAVASEMDKVKEPGQLLDALSVAPHKDTLMNPVRHGDIKKRGAAKEMVTTGQLMLFPQERTLHYRPIHSDIEFDWTKLNKEDSKTFFEIISAKKLLGFKEFAKK